MHWIKPNCEYSEETTSGFNNSPRNSHGRFWSSENRKESHDDKLAITIINRQLRSYVESYDHASRSVACSYDNCIGAVTIILPENKTTISLVLHIYRVFCLVTNKDKLHIYIVCKLYMALWRASITIRPGPNSRSPTSAILYDRNWYDRNCFPTVYLWSVFMFNKRWYRGKNVNWHCSRNVWTTINSTFVILYLNIWDSMFCNILQIITWCFIFNSTSLQCASVWTLWVQSTFWARQIFSLFVGCIRFLCQSIKTEHEICVLFHHKLAIMM